MMIAHVATKGIELAASMLEGDWDKAAEAFKRIPIVGEGATAGFHLGTALANAVGPAVYAALKAIPNLLEGKLEMPRFFGAEALNDIEAELTQKRKAADEREAENEKYRRESREGISDWEISVAEAKAEADELEETRQRERLNVEYNNILAAAAAKGEQKERAAAERKADNERFRRESFEGLADEAMTAAEERDKKAGRYSPVSAFDRGFLTQAPGSTFDQSATAVATAKATETTAKATEKTAKAVETLTARQELLFRELLTAMRPGKIINF
jgi:hypothetical protein